MSQEEYNPQEHCCPRWYKDYCDCHSEYIKKERDKKVNATLKFLDDNNIDYIESSTSNVVIVNPDIQHAYVSLKRERGYLKCRDKGVRDWSLMRDKKFLDTYGKE